MKSNLRKDFDKPKSAEQKAPQHISKVLAQMPISSAVHKYIGVLGHCGDVLLNSREIQDDNEARKMVFRQLVKNFLLASCLFEDLLQETEQGQSFLFHDFLNAQEYAK